MNSNFERTLIKVETKATNSTTGTESRPATARTSLVYSSNAKGDQANERKIKLLNKTLKSLRVDISNLQKENNHMKKVRYLMDDNQPLHTISQAYFITYILSTIEEAKN